MLTTHYELEAWLSYGLVAWGRWERLSRFETKREAEQARDEITDRMVRVVIVTSETRLAATRGKGAM